MNSLEQTPLTEPQASDPEATITNVPEALNNSNSPASELADAEQTTTDQPQTEQSKQAEQAEPAEQAVPVPQEEADAPAATTPQEEEAEAAAPQEEEAEAVAPQKEEAEAEAQAEEEAAVQEEAAPETGNDIPLMMTKEEVLARLGTLVDNGETSDKQELDLLKQLYYKYHNAEAMAARQAYIDAGGDPNDYVPDPDPTEELFKTAMQPIRQRRSDMQLAIEKERQQNMERKLEVIEKIKLLSTTPEEANKSYESFRALQNEWKEIGAVPAEHVTEIWKNYHLYVEQFYDMLKLNSEMREYDFRKNLEAKIILCEQAEKLKDETDVIAAINRLQTLHQEWKEIGPIAKDLREQIWTRFKEASTVIRKRHQQFFEARKAKEEDNLRRKTELCELAEAIETEGLNSFSQWEAKTKEILALQATWKTIGYAPQKANTQIFERFRAAQDKFFSRKADFFKNVKESLADNLAKKTALAEQAEALMDSTDWKKTTDALVELQKQWKSIGTVPRKVSDQLWKRFIGACDHFFAAKSKAHAQQRAEQQENLKKKRDIIEQLKALAADDATATAQQVHDLQDEWNATGHVPMREKDKIYAQYHEVVDDLYKKLNISQAQRRLSSFRTTLKVTSAQGGNSLLRERERLSRAYEMMHGEIQTYENNLGFLSTNSKKGNSLAQEISKKIDKLKDELNLLGQKIKAINEQLRQESGQRSEE